MKSKAFSGRIWLTLVLFSLIGQVAWVVENMYFNVFIYKMFHASAEAISLMVSASAVAATVTTLFIGALSDKLGKRKLFICSGYLVWGVTIWSFALIRQDVIEAVFPATVSAAAMGVSITIILDCVMTVFGSAANDSCFNAWLTDVTNDRNRGTAEGVNAMMPLVAILVVFGGFMGLDLNLPASWVVIFGVIGTVVLLVGVAGFFLIQDVPIQTGDNQSVIANLFYGFRPGVVQKNPELYWTLAAYAVFGISIQIYMPYLILYYNVSLGMDNYVLIMAPAILLAAAFTACYGRVYDRKGFAPAIVPAMLLLMAGFMVLYLFRNTVLVFTGSLLMMCGYLAGMAVFGAMLRDRTPANRSGSFQGLRIVCQVLIPGVIGPAIGAWVLRDAATVLNDDGTSSFIPNESIFMAALIAAVAVWLVMIPLLNRKRDGSVC